MFFERSILSIANEKEFPSLREGIYARYCYLDASELSRGIFVSRMAAGG